MEQIKIGDLIVIRKKVHNAILYDKGIVTAIGQDTTNLVKYQKIICGTLMYKLEPNKLENRHNDQYVDEIWRKVNPDTIRRIWKRPEAEIIEQNKKQEEEESE